jgi:Flp pilus assembly protein TadD
VPVWVALPFTADWRWLREGEDCPWYPSLRLFRQRNAGDWPEVFGRIVRELQTVLAAAAGKPPLSGGGADANALNTRGIALVNEQKFAEAVACFRQALLLKADHADVHSNLGVALEGLNRRQDALIHFRQALRLKNAHVDAHHNLGMSLLRNGAPQEAFEHFQTVVRARPRHAEAHNNLGMALMDQGRTEEAVAAYAEALRLNPDYAEAHVNRAQAWLTLGNLAEGWPEYEWRWKLPGAAARTFRQPRWDGSPLAGKTILLWAEQSLSDTIQFIRYARLLQEQGARVLCQCQRPLARLLSRCPYLDEVFPEGSSIPSFDVHLPLPSLPGIFHSTLRTVPGEAPYLFCDTTLADRWRRESSTLGSFKIGIAWQAELKDRNDSQHSIPLPYFATLALPGVCLISLRRAPGTERLSATETPANIIDFGSIVHESSDPWMETAALLNCLDLVITSDGVTAHLAGALGVPAWVALALPADWRWLRDREDCPWYPSGRLFRQRCPGDWLDLFRRIRDELPISRTCCPVRTKASNMS